MISREQLERDMADFRARMKPAPVRTITPPPPCHAQTDETGVSPQMRALIQGRED